MPESTQFQRLRARFDYLHQYIETVDAALVAASEIIQGYGPLGTGPVGDGNAIRLSKALGHPLNRYKRLDNLPGHRWNGSFRNFSSQKNLEFGLTLISTYFEEYVKTVLKGLPEDATRYKATTYSDLDLEARSVVPILGDAERLKKEIGKRILSKIAAKRYARGIVDSLIKACGLTISPKNLRLAVMVLDVRNLFVHSSGTMTKELWNSHGKILFKELGVGVGKRIQLTLGFVGDCIKRVRTHAADFDAALIAGGWIPARTLGRPDASA